MVEHEVAITNELGLHARAAARLVKFAKTFDSSITLYRSDSGVEADAKSILSLLYLAAGRGVTVRLRAEGGDEGTAAQAITRLLETGLGEDVGPGA